MCVDNAYFLIELIISHCHWGHCMLICVTCVTQSAKAFSVFILSCTSVCKILNFLQIRNSFLNFTLFSLLHNNKRSAHHAEDHLIWNIDFDSIAHSLFKIANKWMYGAVPMCPVIPLALILYLKCVVFTSLYDCYIQS